MTKIRTHYKFEECKFKKDFVAMNLLARQNTQTDVEKDFYKLMNIGNFGYDCCNNADNCYISPIYDEKDKLSFAKRYQNIFDQHTSDFVSSEILERQIEEEYLHKIANLNTNDEYFETRKNSSKIQKKKETWFFNEKIKTEKTPKNIKDIDEKQKDEEKCPKTKSIIEFDTTLFCSIKILAIKKIT